MIDLSGFLFTMYEIQNAQRALERCREEIAERRREQHELDEFYKKRESESYGRDAIDVEAREVPDPPLIAQVRHIGGDRGDEGGTIAPMCSTEQTDPQPHGTAAPGWDTEDPRGLGKNVVCLLSRDAVGVVRVEKIVDDSGLVGGVAE